MSAPLHPSVTDSHPGPNMAMHTSDHRRTQTQTHSEASRNAAGEVADLSCRECRRRKSKCDRSIPVCRLCAKFSRGCTYEKSSRTPLTRTHLSSVENELSRVKGLLRRFMPDHHDLEYSGRGEEGDETMEYVYGGGACATSGSGGITGDVDQRSIHAQDHVQPGPRLHSVAATTHAVRDLPSSSRVDPQARDTSVGAMPLPTPLNSHLQQEARASDTNPVGPRPPSEPRSPGTTAYSLETPSSSSNFEWDERAGTVGGERFVDGMASLTSRSNEGGYLGSASGAALLRLTDTRDGSTTDPEPQQNPNPASALGGNTPYSSIPYTLTSMSQLEPFIDAYFVLYHVSYPIIHEATFRAQFMEIIPRPPGTTWQVLLFVISALGGFTSSTQPTDIDLALFTAAKERLSIDVLETGNLVLVQALTLISNYLQKRNKPNSGYNYMGLARRVAMGIGLHKEFQVSNPNASANGDAPASLLTLEMRRRVWYCLYIFDIGAMITFSRPLDFPVEGVDVHLPVNVHDSDITAQTRHLPPPAQETTIYTHLLAQAEFHLATSHIYSKIISHPLPSAGELLRLDDQYIGGWLADLPPYFGEATIQPPKFSLAHAILRWRYRNFRILMYRPFLVGQIMARSQSNSQSQNQPNPPNASPDVQTAITHCLTSAQEAVTLISTFWLLQTHHRTTMACWYALYFLFQAILIPVICLRNEPHSHLAQGWREQIFTSIEVLESMALLNPTAQRCLGVIQGLCGGYLGGNIDGAWGATEESPQTQLARLYPLMWPSLEVGVLEGDSVIQESTIMDFMNRLPMME